MSKQNDAAETPVKSPNDNILAILSRQMMEKDGIKVPDMKVATADGVKKVVGIVKNDTIANMEDIVQQVRNGDIGVVMPDIKVMTPDGLKTPIKIDGKSNVPIVKQIENGLKSSITVKIDKPTAVPAGSVSVPPPSTGCGLSCACSEKKRIRTASLESTRTVAETYLNRIGNMKNRIESIFSEFVKKAEKVDSSLKNLNEIEGCENIPELDTMKQTVFDSIQKSLVRTLVDAIQNNEYDVPIVEEGIVAGDYINASQAAKMYGCSQGTMTQWLKTGVVNGYVNMKNGRNMILKADVEKLIAKRLEMINAATSDYNAKKAEVIPGVN